MTDNASAEQEQTERGASAVGNTPGPWKTHGTMVYAPGEHGANICEISEPRATSTVQHTRLSLGSPDAAEAFANAELVASAPQLRADLERVTAELAEARRESFDLLEQHAAVRNARIVELEDQLKQAEAERDAMREVEQKARRLTAKWPHRTWAEDVDLRGALARRDATRKATTEHPLPERGPGYDPLCQCGQGQLHRLRLHDEEVMSEKNQGQEQVDVELLSSWMCLFGAVIKQQGWSLSKVRELVNVVFDHWEEVGLPSSKSEVHG